MSIVRLIYFSKATYEMSLLDIQNILTVARTKNKEKDICGMLCYESLWFLQTIEGEEQVIKDLYDVISEDDRHDEMTQISCEEITERKFNGWQMGYAGSSSHFLNALNSIDRTEFRPDQMTAEQCLEFLLVLSKNQTV